MQAQTKVFYFDIKANSRGRYLKISEKGESDVCVCVDVELRSGLWAAPRSRGCYQRLSLALSAGGCSQGCGFVGGMFKNFSLEGYRSGHERP